MSSTQVATSVPSKRLAVSILSTDLSFSLNNILSWQGLQDNVTQLTSADFGTRAFGVFRNPTNTILELFEWDPTTIANSSIKIIARGLSYSGATTGAAVTSYNFNANETIVELGSHTPQLFEQYVDKSSDEQIDGVKTFSSSPLVPTPTLPTQVASKVYVDNVAISGAAFSGDLTAGLVQQGTQAQVEAGTNLGGTGAPLFITPSRSGARIFYGYAADAEASDSYVITCAPVPSTYTIGMLVQFKANTANTGACSININSLGVKSLKMNGVDPRNNYITAGQHVLIEYDGTNFQVLSVSGQPQVSQDGAEVFALSTTGNATYVITLAPAPAAYVTGAVYRFKPDTGNTTTATLNVNGLGAKSILRADSSALAAGDIGSLQMVEVTYDGTNMILLSPLSNSPKISSGSVTRSATTASGTQTIAHGLGRAPRQIKLTVMQVGNTGVNDTSMSVGIYNGTTTNTVWWSIFNGASGAGVDTTNAVVISKPSAGSQVAVATWDATNITLTWTYTPTLDATNMNILWEAFA